MVVKIKCVGCGKSYKMRVYSLKQARRFKRENKTRVCNECDFKIILRRVARQIIKENNYGYGRGTQQRGV